MKTNNPEWPYVVPGIPDEMFARGQVPMTKQEVRTITLSRLRIKPDSVIWDVGAGTGSLSVEAARLAPKGRVYAIERHPEGFRLIEENRRRFNLNNLTIAAGAAPPALEGLPAPDRVIIGGSGGELPSILQAVRERLAPGGVVVANCVTVETLGLALGTLRELGFQSVEGVGVTVTRLVPAGNYHLFQGANPVFILSGIKTEIDR